ncbi:MAG TPA: hypothetical protein VKQ71_04020 [Acidimicrobiales bacterium]|nr:hypothetical protein [Acidimicrobiales bacterium]
MANWGNEQTEPWQEQLLGELRELGRAADPVPPAVLFAAKGSLAWRRIDADLAELTSDSLLDDALAGLRSGDVARLVTFEAEDVSVEMEITATGDSRQLIGQLIPPQTGSVVVRSEHGTVDADADALGRFRLLHLVPGPASLRCRLDESGRVVETGWIVL